MLRVAYEKVNRKKKKIKMLDPLTFAVQVRGVNFAKQNVKNLKNMFACIINYHDDGTCINLSEYEYFILRMYNKKYLMMSLLRTSV